VKIEHKFILVNSIFLILAIFFGYLAIILFIAQVPPNHSDVWLPKGKNVQVFPFSSLRAEKIEPFLIHVSLEELKDRYDTEIPLIVGHNQCSTELDYWTTKGHGIFFHASKIIPPPSWKFSTSLSYENNKFIFTFERRYFSIVSCTLLSFFLFSLLSVSLYTYITSRTKRQMKK
jgi:hypothetical protein